MNIGFRILSGNLGNSIMNDYLGEAKKSYTFLCIKYFVFGILVTALQFLFVLLLEDEYGKEDWYVWGMTTFTIYIIGFPLLLLLFCKTQKTPPQKVKLGIGNFLAGIPLITLLCFVGSIIGNVVSSAILLPFEKSVQETNVLNDLVMNSNRFYMILTVGILAPIFEELIFRKLIIDHVLKYGELAAMLLSGIMFGMFHGNFTQFFYATALGIFFAYVYIRTGKLRYPIFYHMLVNLSSSVITTSLVQRIDLEKVQKYEELVAQQSPEAMDLLMEIFPSMLAFLIWFFFLGLLTLAGLIILIVFLVQKRFFLCPQEKELPKGIRGKAAFLNVGFLLYLLMVLILFFLYYYQIVA